MAAAVAAGENSRLLMMPLEILQQIARPLSTPEYGNLRLSCKHMEASLLNGFSKEFFTKRQFMLTNFSLQALVDISKSRFGEGLKHVIIHVERPSQRSLIHHSDTYIPPTLEAQVKRNRSRDELTDHLALLDSGRDVDLLAQAFANCRNLKTVEIRDFNSQSRYRDRPNVRWRSYGAPTYELQTAANLEISTNYHFPQRSDDQVNYISRLFQNILRALGKTTTRPKRFEVNLRHCGMSDKAFRIQSYDRPAILPVLKCLEDLHLDLNSDFVPAFIAGQDANREGTQCYSYFLRQFLAHVDEIQLLRLNFQFFRAQDSRDFLQWLSRSPEATPAAVSQSKILSPDLQASLPVSPPPLLFKSLKQLEIGKIVVEPKTLLALLRKHKTTLKGLVLYRVGLLDKHPGDERVNQWARFFAAMGKLDLNITYMFLSILGQEKERGEHIRKVGFKEHPTSRRIWSGQDLDGALNDFVNNVTVDWPENDTESSPSGRDDESDEGE